MNAIPHFDRFTDTTLVEVMPRLVKNECGATAVVIAGLAEFDARSLYLPLGYSSLFSYCVKALKLTEDATANRIEAMRAARKFPTAISLTELLGTPIVPPTAPTRRPVVSPLSESHYKLQVTISAAARERLSQIQNLMRHRLPNGDPAAIVEHPLEVLHAQLLKEKAAQVAKPRAGRAATEAKGRDIPASVKREVWRRDQARCAFVRSDGRTCGSEDGVEFHHVQPYAVGGQATAANIEMRCRAHNGFEWTRHLDQETAALIER